MKERERILYCNLRLNLSQTTTICIDVHSQAVTMKEVSQLLDQLKKPQEKYKDKGGSWWER